jgi:hypothetical protein
MLKLRFSRQRRLFTYEMMPCKAVGHGEICLLGYSATLSVESRGLVATDPEIQGSIPGTTGFSEK